MIELLLVLALAIFQQTVNTKTELHAMFQNVRWPLRTDGVLDLDTYRVAADPRTFQG